MKITNILTLISVLGAAVASPVAEAEPEAIAEIDASAETFEKHTFIKPIWGHNRRPRCGSGREVYICDWPGVNCYKWGYGPVEWSRRDYYCCCADRYCRY